MRKVASLMAALAFLAACGVRQQVPVRVPAATREGRTSVRVLSPESDRQGTADVVVETITPAFASDENKLPEYPSYALKGGCQHGLVSIRVYVGPDGNVAGVRSIPDRPLADDQCHPAFWAATCAAVSTWKFAPAFRQKPVPGPHLNGDGRPDYTRWEQAPVMIYLDFEFTFRVVEGKGEVRTR